MFGVFMYGFYGKVLCITNHRCEPVDNFWLEFLWVTSARLIADGRKTSRIVTAHVNLMGQTDGGYETGLHGF